MRTNVPRALRALRARRGWRQADLGARAGLSRDVVHRAEIGALVGITVGSLAKLAQTLGAELVVELRWRGAELDRLVDRAHATVVAAAATRLRALGWLVHPEVSFNHYGDRGRCDLVAWDAASRVLVIVEAKSKIGDIQETLGRVDVKVRLGWLVARELGLPAPDRVVPALVLAESGTNRRVLHRYAALFLQFGRRGRSALAWLRRPDSAVNGLLWFESPDSDQGGTKRGSRAPGRHPAG